METYYQIRENPNQNLPNVNLDDVKTKVEWMSVFSFDEKKFDELAYDGVRNDNDWIFFKYKNPFLHSPDLIKSVKDILFAFEVVIDKCGSDIKAKAKNDGQLSQSYDFIVWQANNWKFVLEKIEKNL